MLETLAAFHARVDGFQHDSLPHSGPLSTRPRLLEKVDPDGKLLPFFGNTMIFDLPESTQLEIARMQLILNRLCGFLLAEPLAPATLHMTLHDLLNGVDEAALMEPVRQTGEVARAILRRQREDRRPIHLTATAAFCMVGGSVGLGFAPDTEEDCARLMALHADYQPVVPLNYPLTPHVTLAYLRPGVYDESAVALLADALRELNALPPVRLTLTTDALHYYRFTDMNTYIRE